MTTYKFHTHDLLKLGTQDLVEASQLLCHHATTPFVGKGCATFCFMFLTIKSLRNPKVDIFLGFKSWSNEANKNVM
jgi:hypothetical protein